MRQPIAKDISLLNDRIDPSRKPFILTLLSAMVRLQHKHGELELYSFNDDDAGFQSKSINNR